jgi:apolipoprotein N-acyltransferase
MAYRNLALQNGCFTCPLQKTLPSSLSRLKSQPKKIDFLVNITNDAWFGRSSGPWIHGMLTRFRAVENRIQIYRSANTGISMVVDPLGNIIHSTGLYQQTQFQAPLYTAKRIPLYYYLAGWERLFCLLGVILFVLALPDVKFPKSHKSKREVKL